MKICCASSSGGHLTELLRLEKAFQGKSHYFVIDRRRGISQLRAGEKAFFVECPRRNALKLLKNFFQSIKIFFAENPDVVISTGADTAIPTCLIAKLFGKKIVFIESYCRIMEPSLSGKMMYPLADLFLVQWEENKKFFPKAEFCGSVF